MLLFFHLLLIIFAIILTVSIILIFSEVKIILNNFEYYTDKFNKIPQFEGKIRIYFLGKIRIFSKKIDSKKTGKLLNDNFIREKITTLKLFYKDNRVEQFIINRKNIKKSLKHLKIDMLKLQIQIDTESVLLTSYLVGIISSLIPNLIRDNIKRCNKQNYEWEVLPIYKNKNSISLKLNSIISIKVVHIINMFKLIGGIKNERSSNRRLNVNCYGEH